MCTYVALIPALPSFKTFLSHDVTSRLRGYLLSEVEVYQVWGGGGGAEKVVCLSLVKGKGSGGGGGGG